MPQKIVLQSSGSQLFPVLLSKEKEIEASCCRNQNVTVKMYCFWGKQLTLNIFKLKKTGLVCRHNTEFLEENWHIRHFGIPCIEVNYIEVLVYDEFLLGGDDKSYIIVTFNCRNVLLMCFNPWQRFFVGSYGQDPWSTELGQASSETSIYAVADAPLLKTLTLSV